MYSVQTKKKKSDVELMCGLVKIQYFHLVQISEATIPYHTTYLGAFRVSMDFLHVIINFSRCFFFDTKRKALKIFDVTMQKLQTKKEWILQ